MVKAMAAGAYRELGEYKKSEEYLKDAYMKVALVHGEEHLATSSILNGMGMLYKKQERFERGRDAYERALDIAEKMLGDEHPETMATRHNLGELFLAWDKKEQAMEYL